MKVDEFLDNFKRIESHLNTLGSFNNSNSFTIKLDEVSKRNSTIRNLKNELRRFADLRNMYSHRQKIKGGYLAEPTNYTLSRIKEIVYKLENPVLVGQKFCFKVIGADKEDYINDILKTMYTNSFSQFPVYEQGEIVEIISSNTVSRWLSDNLEENGNILHTDIRVKDLLPYIEFKKNYSFVSKKKNVDEVFGIFQKQIKHAKRNLDAIFITKNGKEDEEIEGLITIEDIAEYV